MFLINYCRTPRRSVPWILITRDGNRTRKNTQHSNGFRALCKRSVVRYAIASPEYDYVGITRFQSSSCLRARKTCHMDGSAATRRGWIDGGWTYGSQQLNDCQVVLPVSGASVCGLCASVFAGASRDKITELGTPRLGKLVTGWLINHHFP
jgi:hypothetical protein